jgi:uncharacterized protein YdhG (YjbR/CyaY superfamily)
MPFPKRTSPDNFFDLLDEQQRPHLLALREISLSYPEVTETLKWNQPAYVTADGTAWLLQAFAKHCSLRFTPDFFGPFQAEVAAAGYGYGAGFLKIMYTDEVPEQLCRRLMAAKLADSGH